MAIWGKASSQIARMARRLSPVASENIQASKISNTRNLWPIFQIHSRADGQGLDVSKSAQVTHKRVNGCLNAVDLKADGLKATASEPQTATCNLIQLESSTFNNSEVLRRAGRYIRENPKTFILQAGGATVAAGALLTIPVLNIAGFTATGPLASSAAATWQALLGSVQTGSAFAWCQSATMGGAAVGDIIGVGVTGAGVAGAATASRIPGVRKRFAALFRKGNMRPR